MSRMFCTWKEAARTLHTSEDQIRTLVERGILREFREGPHRFVREADIEALSSVRRTEEIEAGAQRTEDRRQTTDAAVIRPPSSVLQGPLSAVQEGSPAPATGALNPGSVRTEALIPGARANSAGAKPERPGRRQPSRSATAVGVPKRDASRLGSLAQPSGVRKTKTRRLKMQNRRRKDTRQKRESRGQEREDRGRKIDDRRQRAEDERQRTEGGTVVRPESPNATYRTGSSTSSVAPALSVRQWFWMGLVQDRPMAIALLAGLVLLILSALVAGVCLLTERL
jgi:hypothetical protein